MKLIVCKRMLILCLEVFILADNAGWELLTPAKVVEMLDCHIVGQQDAKRAVAVALRMRFQPLV